jgi:cold shock CspA family protein
MGILKMAGRGFRQFFKTIFFPDSRAVNAPAAVGDAAGPDTPSWSWTEMEPTWTLIEDVIEGEEAFVRRGHHYLPDGRGNSLAVFSRGFFNRAVAFGVGGILVDFPTVPNVINGRPLTIADYNAINPQRFPRLRRQSIQDRIELWSVRWFIETEDGASAVFFHISMLGGDEVYVGDRVEYETKQTPKGLSATKVKLLDDEVETVGGPLHPRHLIGGRHGGGNQARHNADQHPKNSQEAAILSR